MSLQIPTNIFTDLVKLIHTFTLSPNHATCAVIFELYSVTGDSRANLNLGIALFHNMFLRFHNFVAFKLKTGNALWSDEKLYQESRRFVGAIIQHITYTQFLPIILGIFILLLNNKVLNTNEKYFTWKCLRLKNCMHNAIIQPYLGKNYTENKVLGSNNKYDPTVNPSTSQEFSTGAFRVLHNIVPAQHR